MKLFKHSILACVGTMVFFLANQLPSQAQACTYTVQVGDSIFGIAHSYGLQMWELQELNDDKYPFIWENQIQPGMILTVPCVDGQSPSPPVIDENSNPSTSSSSVIGVPVVNNLNVRSGPGITFAVLGQVNSGQKLYLVERNASSDWVYFINDDQQGWVAAWLLTITGNVSDLPITSTPITPTTPPISSEPTINYTGHYSNIGPNLNYIYQQGQALGRNPYRFSKVGDSETWNQHFLQPFTSPHNLGPYSYLSEVINLYFGSMSHLGQAAEVGFSASAIVNPLWADPNLCKLDETPLACEYRLHNPAIALIMVRTWQADGSYNSDYGEALREIVGYSIDQGVIPVLSTVPHHNPPWTSVEPINDTIRQVAHQYNVPLWDLYVTTQTLPQYGVDETSHLTIPPDYLSGNLTDAYMQYGKNRRNLEALEVLYQILNEVIQ